MGIIEGGEMKGGFDETTFYGFCVGMFAVICGGGE